MPNMHVRIPWTALFSFKPIPDIGKTERHEYPRRPSQGPGQMRRGVADRDHGVTGAREGRKSVDIVGVIDIVQTPYRNSDFALDRGALLTRVAILKIHEYHALHPQNAREIDQPRAFVVSHHRTYATP